MIPLEGRPSPTTPAPRTSLAGQAADDHVDDGDDAVQDGTEDGADGVDDAHQASADSVEDAGDLDEGVSASMLRDGQCGGGYIRRRRRHPFCRGVQVKKWMFWIWRMESGLRLGFGGDAGSRAGGGSCMGGSVAEGTHCKKRASVPFKISERE